MISLFSSDTRYRTWRKLWAVLARTEMELGLPITQQQVDELFAHIDDIDYEAERQREKEVRHDVMAHVWTYGKAAPSAAGIIPVRPPTNSSVFALRNTNMRAIIFPLTATDIP